MRIRLFTTVLAVLFVACSATAQKATVKSFIQTTDHIPSGDRRNDLNGTPCALVKIQVVDNIERVEGNIIGDVVNRGVPRGRRLRLTALRLPTSFTFRRSRG